MLTDVGDGKEPTIASDTEWYVAISTKNATCSTRTDLFGNCLSDPSRKVWSWIIFVGFVIVFSWIIWNWSLKLKMQEEALLPVQDEPMLPADISENSRAGNGDVGNVENNGSEKENQKQGNIMTVGSTSYCLQGTTASGRPVGQGIVAMKAGTKLGTKMRVLTGPLQGRIFSVLDRIPARDRSDFDIWMSSCEAAIQYGRQQIKIEEIE